MKMSEKQRPVDEAVVVESQCRALPLAIFFRFRRIRSISAEALAEKKKNVETAVVLEKCWWVGVGWWQLRGDHHAEDAAPVAAAALSVSRDLPAELGLAIAGLTPAIQCIVQHVCEASSDASGPLEPRLLAADDVLVSPLRAFQPLHLLLAEEPARTVLFALRIIASQPPRRGVALGYPKADAVIVTDERQRGGG